ncbi:MAG TPA: ATP-binding protein [Vicinamibacterales bacterium]|nr:ATP-binding protein [Vicinamibacterales bacterium]
MGISLRRRLVALTAAAILPLAVMAGIGLVVLHRQQTKQTERVGLELSRSVANAVDAELRSVISTAETLATSLTLDRPDLEGFRERAGRVLQLKPEWAAIILSDLSGTPLLDTRAGPGQTPPALVDKDSFEQAVRSAAPVIGGLVRHQNQQWLFAVRVPAIREGATKYIVTALVKPDTIRAVLVRQQAPDDWVISIVDATGVRVARSRAHEENLGGRLSESARHIVDRGGAEGFGISYSLEGQRIFTPFSRLGGTGWTAVLGMPTAVVDAAAYRSLTVYGGGVLLSILLGTLGAQWVARGITRPIAALRAAAEALGRRAELPAPPVTSIQEIRDVGSALTTAAAALSRSEAEREDLLAKERRAREAAEAADRTKDEFMTLLSHELRTPLNAVYGWARMLQSGQIQDDALAERAKDAIVRNADMQVQLIDDLLDFARIASGKMRLDITSVDVAATVHSALDAVRPAADGKGLRLQTDIDAHAGRIPGDAARLQQVVWNLLMNAIKFTPRGGFIEVRVRHLGSHLTIVVRDNGEGIAPELLPHVFERFRQADSSSTRTHRGLGLGLTLVEHLVELHGGTVAAHSAGRGHGATFTVTLPVAIARVPPESAGGVPASARSEGARPSLVRLDGLRILITDDEADSIALAEAILVGAGALVRSCRTASAAYDELRRWHPDVLVSDIEMPNEDGYSLIQKVRALTADEGGETPAIALTAYGRPQDRLRCLAAGFTMHVPKPVDPGELTAIIAGVARPPR